MPSATQRLREQSRRAVGTETAAAVTESVRSEQIFGGGNEVLAERFEIRSVSTAQESYPPAGGVSVTVEYGSTSQEIPTSSTADFDHPDNCERGGLFDSLGVSLVPQVSVRGGTSATGDGGCWDPTNTDSTFETVQVAAPDRTGTGVIDVELKGRNTGTTYSTATKEIQLTTGADEEADREQDDEDEEDDDGLSDTTLLALGGATFALIALILS
jgi:hypothetical protein